MITKNPFALLLLDIHTTFLQNYKKIGDIEFFHLVHLAYFAPHMYSINCDQLSVGPEKGDPSFNLEVRDRFEITAFYSSLEEFHKVSYSSTKKDLYDVGFEKNPAFSRVPRQLAKRRRRQIFISIINFSLTAGSSQEVSLKDGPQFNFLKLVGSCV